MHEPCESWQKHHAADRVGFESDQGPHRCTVLRQFEGNDSEDGSRQAVRLQLHEHQHLYRDHCRDRDVDHPEPHDVRL